MMKKQFAKLLLASSLLLPMAAQADVIGASVGVGSWNQSLSSSSSIVVDPGFSPNLGSGEESSTFFWAALEHPLPVIPNIKVMQTPLTINGPTDSLTLDQTDMILYYEVLDNIVSVDVGLNIKDFSGNVSLAGTDHAFPATLPLLYADVSVKIPVVGLKAGVTVNRIAAGDNEFTDTFTRIAYETTIGLGIEFGNRSQSLKIDTSGVNSDLTVEGSYLGLYFDI